MLAWFPKTLTTSCRPIRDRPCLWLWKICLQYIYIISIYNPEHNDVSQLFFPFLWHRRMIWLFDHNILWNLACAMPVVLARHLVVYLKECHTWQSCRSPGRQEKGDRFHPMDVVRWSHHGNFWSLWFFNQKTGGSRNCFLKIHEKTRSFSSGFHAASNLIKGQLTTLPQFHGSSTKGFNKNTATLW